MSDSLPPILFPVYAADLRQLVAESFADPQALPRAPLPGGPLDRREMMGQVDSQAELVCCAPWGNASEDPLEISADHYWELALAHRTFAIGPLLCIAQLDVGLDHRLAIERRVLDTYNALYENLPLSADLLRLLGEANDASADVPVAGWLEGVRQQFTKISSAAELTLLREQCRVEALVLGARREWTDRQTSIVELLIDVICLSRAVFEDIGAAMALSADFNGSVALALHDLESKTLRFEEILPALARSTVSTAAFPAGEVRRVQRFVDARATYSHTGLLPRLAPEKAPTTAPTSRIFAPFPRRAVHQKQPKPVEASARETYFRVLRELKKVLLARPTLCSELALIGTAHVHGMPGQRVLLAGPSGVGKTLACQAIAKAIDRKFMIVSIPDITATGWYAAGIIDVLNSLFGFSDADKDAVLVMDECDKATVIPGSTGNSVAAARNLQSSLMGCLDRQPLTTESGHQIETAQLLVIGAGAFENRFATRPPTTDELVAWGWNREFAARWEQRICIAPPTHAQAVELLRSSNRSVGSRLGPLLKALAVEVSVPEAVLRYAAGRWLRSGTDMRSAAEWLIAAARRKVIAVLESGAEPQIVLSPDDLETADDVVDRPDDGDDSGDDYHESTPHR